MGEVLLVAGNLREFVADRVSMRRSTVPLSSFDGTASKPAPVRGLKRLNVPRDRYERVEPLHSVKRFRQVEVLPHLAVESGTDPPTCDKLHRLRDAHGPGSTDRRQIAEDVPAAGGTQVRNVTDGLLTQDLQGRQCLREHVIKAPCSPDRQTAWQADSPSLGRAAHLHFARTRRPCATVSGAASGWLANVFIQSRQSCL
jgi:hypothetical protein